MTTTSFTRKNASGSSAAASAMFVNGPMATIVIVSGSFSRRRRRISRCEGSWEGVKLASVLRSSSAMAACSGWVESEALAKRSFHVSAGVRCGCWDLVSIDDDAAVLSCETYALMDATKSILSIYVAKVSAPGIAALSFPLLG